MRSRFRRIAVGAGLMAAGGFLLAGTGSGCISFTGEAVTTMTDFCFIFDCTNGILGGTIDPCATQTNFNTGDAFFLLADCTVPEGP